MILFFRSSPTLCTYAAPFLANMPSSLNVYAYPVRAKRKTSRTGVCVPQYDSATSSERERAVRSVRPRKAKRTAMRPVVGECALNSLGVG